MSSLRGGNRDWPALITGGTDNPDPDTTYIDGITPDAGDRVIIVGYSQSARIATIAKRPSSRTTHQKPPNPMRPRLTRWPAGCGHS
jgi:hypothetical protein